MHVSVDVLVTELRSLALLIDRQQESAQRQRQLFENLKKDVLAINTTIHQCEYFDVGGEHFHIDWEVLQHNQDGDHYFSILMSGEFEEIRDNDGYLFIDRDPEFFSSVLLL
jgi:hypothetical protein